MENDIKHLTRKIIDFRNARDWKQFHTPKDLAISLSLEAAELLEHFQWKNNKEIEKYVKTNKEEISEEMADIFNYLLIMAHDFKIDLLKAGNKKVKKNEEKYPVNKAKGKHTKYNKL